MRSSSSGCILFVAALACCVGFVSAAEKKPGSKPKTTARARTFQFTYAGAVTGLAPGKMARIWLPMPSTNEDQAVKLVAKDLPAKDEIGKDAQYGNQIISFEAKADDDGKIPFSVTYQVERREVKGDPKKKGMDDMLLARFLLADSKVPVGGKCLELLKDKTLPRDQFDAARVLYDTVNQHMRYDKKGTGWGRGDSVWACQSGYGNCSDFHSLFISLARAQKIPAKFEIGFPIPEKRGAGDVAGYHCWAKFRPDGKDWIPVDISEANKNEKMKDYYFGNLTEDRVAFTVGRDIDLVPKQTGDPLNFFIYPYVEVDGKPHPAEKFEKKFSYEDVK